MLVGLSLELWHVVTVLKQNHAFWKNPKMQISPKFWSRLIDSRRVFFNTKLFSLSEMSYDFFFKIPRPVVFSLQKLTRRVQEILFQYLPYCKVGNLDSKMFLNHTHDFCKSTKIAKKNASTEIKWFKKSTLERRFFPKTWHVWKNSIAKLKCCKFYLAVSEAL